jgi:hypothetical protein
MPGSSHPGKRFEPAVSLPMTANGIQLDIAHGIPFKVTRTIVTSKLVLMSVRNIRTADRARLDDHKVSSVGVSGSSELLRMIDEDFDLL